VAAEGPVCEQASAAVAVLIASDTGPEQALSLLGRAGPARRATVAGALAGNPAPWADELLDELAGDEEERVRRVVAQAAGWTDGASDARTVTGLRACLPDDVASAATLLSGLRHREADLPPDGASIVDELVMAAACAAKVDGAEIEEVVQISGRPRTAVLACMARVRWLSDQPQDFDAMFSRDSLPDELSETVRDGAKGEDVEAILDLVEDDSLTSEARDTAVKLLGWIDGHDELVDERMIGWLRDGDRELEVAASKLLRAVRDPARLRDRAVRLLAADPPINLTDLLIEAREPMWMTGSDRIIYGRIADLFDKWAGDDDERLAEVGRVAAARFRARAYTANTADGDDDPDVDWG
jgi:hypothetical protein